MKSVHLKKWFTLIELLVVITIIGILATGAVAVYTSQIQKARDSTRTTDVKSLQWWVEQYYWDVGEYPTATTFSGVTVYVQMPSDPKTGQAAWTPFDYLYNVSQDVNTIPNQEYELSTTYEQTANRTEKAAKDGGNDAVRLEIGINLGNTAHDTVVGAKIDAAVTKFQCVAAGGGWSAACWGSAPMVIRK